ncbi:MAG TPA: PTS beta-glucoside transporter subunit EIIBCA [Lachnospiraceae bacterium]|nr:PTS beta-glucoside transporter subunit EIIBCA [Lachnospiraceae bacterium]
MAMDYAETSKKIIEAVGGAGNIASASHCMTRLRLVLKDDSRASDEKVQKIKGVKSVIRQGGQYQVVIGNEVSNLFKEFKKLGNWGEAGSAPVKAEGNVVQRLFGFVSGCMTPMLPAMLGCGMLKVVLTLLTTFAGMSTESSTYILLFAFADCFFTFLPIFLGYTISRKMGGSAMLFMTVGAALCYPNLISLMGGSLNELGVFLGMPCTYLFGIPVICATYTSSVLPMLLMAPVMKWAEDFADRVSPNVLKSFLKPLLFIIICIPCSLYVLGPLGNLLGSLLSNVFVAMYSAAPWLTVAIMSAIMPFIVMTGMHYALVPLMFNNLATIGYDVIVAVTMFCSNIAQGGATFGVAFKSKNEETRSEGIACGISAAVAGVTEPAMYGINLRFMKPMIGAVIGAGISGLFCGLTSVRGYVAGGSPSFLSVITFIGGEGNPMRSAIFGAIGGVMSLLISAVIAFILYKDPEEEASASDDSGETSAVADTVIVSPLIGEAVALTSIQDAVFSAETLGKGIAVEPTVGEVYAPCDGVISTFFDTGHAFGLTADTGAEFLIHVGMDTIKLNGEGFTPMVKEGDRVKQGQLLLKFDIDFIKSQGLTVTTPVVVSNTDEFSSVTALASGKVDQQTKLLEIKK